MTTTPTSFLGALPREGRERLLALARGVGFASGARIFEEGQRAERFWIVRTGSVTLDVRVPGRGAAPVGTLHAGDLLGWSWLVPPYTWRLGAEALSPVRALEFDVAQVQALCGADPAFGLDLVYRVAEVIGRRLHESRTRLLDLYRPLTSGL